MAEITAEGYQLKIQNDWFAQERQLYLDIDPNWNLDPSTPDGLKLASDSETFANLDELGLLAYNSKDPAKATGYDLDVLSRITGTIRQTGTSSNVVLTLTGIQGAVIIAGSRVRNVENGSLWRTDSAVTIGVSGSETVNATAIETGPTQASIGAISEIVDPASGWQAVTNAAVATPGTSEETDAELRSRRDESVSRPGNNQLDSMYSEIAATEGVRRVEVYENDTGTDNFYGRGLPANSVAAIVDGGTDEDVALSIYIKKNPGCALHAVNTPVVVPVTSPVTGNEKDITFSRPVPVDVTVTIEISDQGNLPSDIVDQVTQAVLDYVDGTLIPGGTAFDQTGFEIGEDVPVGRMFTPANSVVGQYSPSYVASILLNGAVATIPIAFNELSRFTEANIDVVLN